MACDEPEHIFRLPPYQHHGFLAKRLAARAVQEARAASPEEPSASQASLPLLTDAIVPLRRDAGSRVSGSWTVSRANGGGDGGGGGVRLRLVLP